MLKDKLKEWFGYDAFNPGQREIIESILEAATHIRCSANWEWEKFMLSISYLYEQATHTHYFSANIING